MAQIRLGEALVQAGLIDEYQLKSALGQQRRWGGRLGKALIDLGFIDEATLLSFLSEKLKFSAVDLSRSKIAPKTFAAVPKRIAEKYMVVPVL
jgi:type IV pilus assembly protein PilB